MRRELADASACGHAWCDARTIVECDRLLRERGDVRRRRRGSGERLISFVREPVLLVLLTFDLVVDVYSTSMFCVSVYVFKINRDRSTGQNARPSHVPSALRRVPCQE